MNRASFRLAEMGPRGSACLVQRECNGRDRIGKKFPRRWHGALIAVRSAVAPRWRRSAPSFGQKDAKVPLDLVACPATFWRLSSLSALKRIAGISRTG